MTIETRFFVGQTGTQAFAGFAGFQVGQRYVLRYEWGFFMPTPPAAAPHM